MWLLDGTRHRSFPSTHVKPFPSPVGEPDLAALISSGSIADTISDFPTPRIDETLENDDVETQMLFVSIDEFEDLKAAEPPDLGSRFATVLTDVVSSLGFPSDVLASRIVSNTSQEAHLPEIGEGK